MSMIKGYNGFIKATLSAYDIIAFIWSEAFPVSKIPFRTEYVEKARILGCGSYAAGV